MFAIDHHLKALTHNRRCRIGTLLPAIALLAVFLFSATFAHGAELRVGVIPALTQGSVKEGLDRLALHLEAELEKDVFLNVYADYAAVVAALGFGHVDLAYLGPRTYVIAQHRYGARAILTQLIDGEPFYHSYFIVPSDSTLSSIEELEGKQVAFADPSSTSGSLIPKLALMELGIDPNRDLRALHTGAHDATALAVQNKHVDAGAIDSAYFNLLLRQGRIREEAFKIIWQSERLFQYPWVVPGDMDEDAVESIRAAFLSIDDPMIFDAFGATGFTLADSEDYDVIYRAAQAFGDLD